MSPPRDADTEAAAAKAAARKAAAAKRAAARRAAAKAAREAEAREAEAREAEAREAAAREAESADPSSRTATGFPERPQEAQPAAEAAPAEPVTPDTVSARPAPRRPVATGRPAATARPAASKAEKPTPTRSGGAQANAARTAAARSGATQTNAAKTAAAHTAAAHTAAAKTAAAKTAAAKTAAAAKSSAAMAAAAEAAGTDAAPNEFTEAAPVSSTAPVTARQTVSKVPVVAEPHSAPVADPPVADPPVADPKVAEPAAVDADATADTAAAAAPAPAAPSTVARSPRMKRLSSARTSRRPQPEPALVVDEGAVVLSATNLMKRFGQNVAVSGIDLEVRAGSFYGIVGPNGAGKTTTLSMITGLLRPDSGSITIHGIDVWARPVEAKRIIGVLPDRLRVFDRLTGAQLLYYAGILRGLDSDTVRSRSADLAAAFGLEDALNRLVADYSAGMTKKIALACSMIHSPRVLVLDEPFESVDPVSAVNVTEILQRYVASGGTVLLSSHGMDLIQRVCDHVAIIVQGQVLASGTIDEVRGEKSLEDRFVELAGGRKVAEGMEWLHSFSD
jgi:ABC-type multidrug transport system ATPase subunit